MPMHQGMKWSELQNILDYTQAKYLITSQKLIKPHSADIAASELEQVYVVEPDNLQKPFVDYAELLKSSSNFETPAILSDSPAFVLLTSGSDGQPKAVKLSHANLAHILAYRHIHTRLTLDSISVVASCLTQSVGLYQSLALLAVGATQVLLESYDIDQMADCVNRYKPTHLIMTIDAFDKLLHHPDITENSLSNITFAAAGADRITPRLQDRFIVLTDRPLWITYGLTESSWALVNKGDRLDKCLSLGKPCPGIEIKLTGDDGQEVSVDTVGEIFIRSPRTMLGYLHDENLTRNTLMDGWLSSGDLAYKDADGYFWFAGRKKNIIVLNTGDNVSPVEIENIILDHPDITNCVVTGKKDIDGSYVPWAYVTCRSQSLTEAVLDAYLRERISDHKIPRRIIILSELPIGLTGKVHRTNDQNYSVGNKNPARYRRMTA
ncbi:MAG: hypothetical protein A2W76_03500 [Gammaproteobacteria bacterium RIFCSPLOWO2_12_47_11]|nr:MAG: hypothetical protein A2W76_03500 [Gammaproteobacteria bacterium RIFCSPLOWO2_12_47_11]